MTDTFSAYHHQDGEWDCSMSNISGNEDIDWKDSVTIETTDGTKIKLSRSGRVKIEGEKLTVKD